MLDLAITSKQGHKVHLILATVFPPEQMDVPDSYHGALKDFEQVCKMLNAACDSIVKEIQ